MRSGRSSAGVRLTEAAPAELKGYRCAAPRERPCRPNTVRADPCRTAALTYTSNALKETCPAGLCPITSVFQFICVGVRSTKAPLGRAVSHSKSASTAFAGFCESAHADDGRLSRRIEQVHEHAVPGSVDGQHQVHIPGEVRLKSVANVPPGRGGTRRPKRRFNVLEVTELA